MAGAQVEAETIFGLGVHSTRLAIGQASSR
jgi:hypothetical protein